MSNKKINKRITYTTEFKPGEIRKLNKIMKLTGTTKAILLRGITRHYLEQFYKRQMEENKLLELARLGKF